MIDEYPYQDQYQWLAQDRRTRLMHEAQQARLAREARQARRAVPGPAWWWHKLTVHLWWRKASVLAEAGRPQGHLRSLGQ